MDSRPEFLSTGSKPALVRVVSAARAETRYPQFSASQDKEQNAGDVGVRADVGL
jgi:hypothetical protein